MVKKTFKPEQGINNLREAEAKILIEPWRRSAI